MPGAADDLGLRRRHGAHRAERRGDGADRRHLARLRQRDRLRADLPPTRWACRRRRDPGGPGRHRDLPVWPRQLQLARRPCIGGSATELAAEELKRQAAHGRGARCSRRPGRPRLAEDGQIFVAGQPRPLGRLSTRWSNQIYRYTFGRYAEDVEPGLEATRYFRMGNIYHQPETQGRFSNYPAWPNGARPRASSKSIPRHGMVKLLRYCMVEDAGTVINPLLADANLHGAIAQGIGGAIYEEIVYDDDGPAPDRHPDGLHDPDRGRDAALRDRRTRRRRRRSRRWA